MKFLCILSMLLITCFTAEEDKIPCTPSALMGLLVCGAMIFMAIIGFVSI